MKKVQNVALNVSNTTNLKNKDSTVLELVEKPERKKVQRDVRELYVNNAKRNKAKYKFANNYVKTSKYTWYDFFPKSLLLQFMRVANIYFLFIMFFQCINVISPLNSSTAIFPLCVVLSISIIRELMEDIARHKQDDKENNILVSRYDSVKGSYVTDASKNIEVGDVILVKENDTIPADCVLLSCANLNRVAFIETANLDGEKDLKPRNCVPQLSKFFKEANDTLRISGKITCNKPIADLKEFNGKIELSRTHSYPLSLKQFLYKGTKLKNTKWALGVTVYSGKESKVVLNSQKGAPKISDLEKTVNNLIFVIFSFQVVLCLILAILNSAWYKSNFSTAIYLAQDLNTVITSNAISGALTFFTFLLLF